jgi:hypothetical protein
MATDELQLQAVKDEVKAKAAQREELEGQMAQISGRLMGPGMPGMQGSLLDKEVRACVGVQVGGCRWGGGGETGPPPWAAAVGPPLRCLAVGRALAGLPFLFASCSRRAWGTPLPLSHV